MFSTAIVSLSAVANGPDPGAGGFLARFRRHAAGPGSKRSGWARRRARQGRSAAQVAANLGVAAHCLQRTGAVLADRHRTGFPRDAHAPMPLFRRGAGGAGRGRGGHRFFGDGQVLGGRPRMITTLRPVEPGTDGAVSLAGTLAGVVAAGIVAALPERWRCGGDQAMFCGRVARAASSACSSTACWERRWRARLAEQRCGEFSLHCQRGGVCAGAAGVLPDSGIGSSRSVLPRLTRKLGHCPQLHFAAIRFSADAAARACS